MSKLVGFEVPKMDLTPGSDLLTRFKRFRQKCELLLDGPLKSRDGTQKCKYVLLWSGDYGLDLFNTWTLTEEQQKKSGRILDKIRRSRQTASKPYLEQVLSPRFETE